MIASEMMPRKDFKDLTRTESAVTFAYTCASQTFGSGPLH